MNDINYWPYKGKKFNYVNRYNVIKMESILDKILGDFNNKTNPNNIFIDDEAYSQVMIRLKLIKKIWHSIKNHSKNMEYTYYKLMEIDEIINSNIKYYDRTTYDKLFKKPFLKLPKVIIYDNQYNLFEELDLLSKLDSDSVSSGVKNKKIKKG